MSKKSEEFFNVMLEFLPETVNEYRKSMKDYGEVLETIVIEDIFMPRIIRLLEEEKNTEVIKKIFNYFEDISNCGDEHLINIFSITVLEILGNDKQTLGVAQKYMGKKTIKLQIEADRELGRI